MERKGEWAGKGGSRRCEPDNLRLRWEEKRARDTNHELRALAETTVQGSLITSPDCVCQELMNTLSWGSLLLLGCWATQHTWRSLCPLLQKELRAFHSVLTAPSSIVRLPLPYTNRTWNFEMASGFIGPLFVPQICTVRHTQCTHSNWQDASGCLGNVLSSFLPGNIKVSNLQIAPRIQRIDIVLLNTLTRHVDQRPNIPNVCSQIIGFLWLWLTNWSNVRRHSDNDNDCSWSKIRYKFLCTILSVSSLPSFVALFVSLLK